MAYFNSRPREGGDCSSLTVPSKTLHFNSRPREGGDGYKPADHIGMIISIHAPAKGATAQRAAQERAGYFNSRPREGGDASV